MPVGVLVAVAVGYTTAEDHMNFALDYCSQQTSPLLSILSIYYMNNSLFPFPHPLKLRFFNMKIMKLFHPDSTRAENIALGDDLASSIVKVPLYYSPIKYPVIVSIIAAAPAMANNASTGSATIGIQLYKTNKKALTHTPVHQ